MSDRPPTWDDGLVALNRAIRSLDNLVMPDPSIGQDIDVVGFLRGQVKDLQRIIRGIEAEMDEGSGQEYRAVPRRAAKRSYNSGRIIQDLGDAGFSFMDLVRDDVVRLQWQWSNLRQAASQGRVTLSVAGQELDPAQEGDLDYPHVGEVWTERLEVKPR